MPGTQPAYTHKATAGSEALLSLIENRILAYPFKELISIYG